MMAEYEKEKVKWAKRMEKQGKMAAIQEAEVRENVHYRRNVTLYNEYLQERVAAHRRLAREGREEGAEVELR